MTDVLDIIKDEVLSPRILLRAISFMGWPVMLAGYLPGFLGTAAEVAIHTAPGLLEGESFSDAFVAEYGWRLKLAASHMTGLAAAELSATLAAQLGAAAGGLGISEAAEKKIRELLDRARQEFGDQAVDALERRAQELADRQIDQAFARVMGDPAFADAVRSMGPDELRRLGVRGIAARFGVRDDVAALAANAILHERVFDLSPEKFSIATGESLRAASDREGPVLDPIVVENSGAFAETPEEAARREAIEAALRRRFAQPPILTTAAKTGVVLAPLFVALFLAAAARR